MIFIVLVLIRIPKYDLVRADVVAAGKRNAVLERQIGLILHLRQHIETAVEDQQFGQRALKRGNTASLPCRSHHQIGGRAGCDAVVSLPGLHHCAQRRHPGGDYGIDRVVGAIHPVGRHPGIARNSVSRTPNCRLTCIRRHEDGDIGHLRKTVEVISDTHRIICAIKS